MSEALASEAAAAARARERRLLEDLWSGVPGRQHRFLAFIHEPLRKTCLFFHVTLRASGPQRFTTPDELYNMVIQDLLGRASSFLRDWDGQRPLQAYAMRACRNRIIDLVRHMHSRTRHEVLVEAGDVLLGGVDDPRDRIASKLYVERLLEAALFRLTTEKARAIFRDLFLRGLSDDEVMAANGLKRVANVHLWRFKLLAHLRETAELLDRA